MRFTTKKKGLWLPKGMEFTPASLLLSMPVYSPSDISQRLTALGYRGQEEARRAVCLCAYRHMKRLRNIYLDKVTEQQLPARANALLMGPTGCGKSYLIELLFGEILKLPCVLVEMTRFTETGYVGDNVCNILNQLIDQVQGRIDIAECGIVALDEFDKIAASPSNIRFGGGSYKDVSGRGVQRELLKMLEGADIVIPREYEFTHYSSRARLTTRNITFFALGAFSGFKVDDFGVKNVGFASQRENSERNEVAYVLGKREANDILKFQSYGFLPELIARFSHIIPFQPLDRETLLGILDMRIATYTKEFSHEGFALNITASVRQAVVEEAMCRQTGARGLDTILMEHVEEIAYKWFGQQKRGTITLRIRKGQLNSEVRLKA